MKFTVSIYLDNSSNQNFSIKEEQMKLAIISELDPVLNYQDLFILLFLFI